MRWFSFLLASAMSICCCSSLFATTIHVPGDATTIQGGIDSAANGDTVLVYSGTYVENIDFVGKTIVVTSRYGPGSTVIDGNQQGSAVTFASGEGRSSKIQGFTITNGSGTYFDDYWEYGGGGIYCVGSSPTIRNNSIAGNSANNGGGIALVIASSPLVENNHIYENSADTPPGRMGGGGGIVIGWSSHPVIAVNDIHNNYSNMAGGGVACGFECNPEIKNNSIRDNVANVYGGGIQIYSNTMGKFINNVISGNSSLGTEGAGGISCRLGSMPVIANNLIIGNTAATYGGGIRCFDDAVPLMANNLIIGNEAGISGGGIECDRGAITTMTNTILWDNQAPAGKQMWVGPRSGSPATLTISYADVEGGLAAAHVDPGSILNWGTGMINADPLFRDPETFDYHLMATTCGDAYDSPCIDAGDPLVNDAQLNCSHGLATVQSDMGAYGGQGTGPVVSVENDGAPPSRSIQLLQNYPNPLNPSTTIQFELSGNSCDTQQVMLAVYDIRGRHVHTLIDSPLEPGVHAIRWDGRNKQGGPVSSGVYFYRLQTGADVETKKMTLMR